MEEELKLASPRLLEDTTKSELIELNAILRTRIEELQAKLDELEAENLRLRVRELSLAAQLKKKNLQESVPGGDGGSETPNTCARPLKNRSIPGPSRAELEEAIRLARMTDLRVISEESSVDFEEQAPVDTSAAAADASKGTNPSHDIFGALVDLTGSISRETRYPVDGGGYADVYTGTLLHEKKEVKVAIKVIRSHTFTELNRWKIDKRLRREIRVWSCLNHPNVLSLLGVAHDFGPYISMVCPWMNEGDLHRYLADHRGSLTLADRLNLLSDVAEGISYLHSLSIVHGDITTGNILIDSGKACLSDFGLSNILSEFQGTSFMSSTVGGALRWAAPELYRVGIDTEEIPDLTKPCDIYSFGSVALQVISGRIPYDDVASDMLVLVDLMKGKYPRRPAEPLLTDAFWDFILLCWKVKPRSRPDADGILEILERLKAECTEQLLGSLLSPETVL